MSGLTKQPQPRRYEVRVHPSLDKDMDKLAKRLKQNRSQVFHRAMRLYIELKNRQLDRQEDPDSPPFRVLLDDKESEEIEFTDF